MLKLQKLRIWLNNFFFLFFVVAGSSLSSLLSAVRHFPSTNSLLDDPKRCFDTANIWSPCSCHLEMCIGWYPCGLKYCKGKSTDKSSSNTSYRCGIKTCKKCSLFSYYVRQKQLCLWDEWHNCASLIIPLKWWYAALFYNNPFPCVLKKWYFLQ